MTRTKLFPVCCLSLLLAVSPLFPQEEQKHLYEKLMLKPSADLQLTLRGSRRSPTGWWYGYYPDGRDRESEVYEQGVESQGSTYLIRYSLFPDADSAARAFNHHFFGLSVSRERGEMKGAYCPGDQCWMSVNGTLIAQYNTLCFEIASVGHQAHKDSRAIGLLGTLADRVIDNARENPTQGKPESRHLLELKAGKYSLPDWIPPPGYFSDLRLHDEGLMDWSNGIVESAQEMEQPTYVQELRKVADPLEEVTIWYRLSDEPTMNNLQQSFVVYDEVLRSMDLSVDTLACPADQCLFSESPHFVRLLVRNGNDELMINHLYGSLDSMDQRFVYPIEIAKRVLDYQANRIEGSKTEPSQRR